MDFRGTIPRLFLHPLPVGVRAAGLAQPQAGASITIAQVGAARKIYSGPHNQRNELLFPGYEPGGEAIAGDWATWITGTSSATSSAAPPAPGGALQGVLGFGFGCDLMQGVTSCDYLSIDVDQQDATARETLQPILSSVDPNLRPFRNHGGKMIQYAGWNDTAIAPENGLNYYRAVEHNMGDVHDFYRVFMVPGMAHCSGGAGPNAFGNGVNAPVIDADHDLLKALERWVEQGAAPDKIIGTHYVNNNSVQGVVQFQRPLCPYPQRGEYNGVGNPNDASRFNCFVHHDEFDPRNIGRQVAYIEHDNRDRSDDH